MSARLKSLSRLTALYEIVEHANGVALDQARGALYEVETKISETAAAAARLSASGEEALRRGELREWQFNRSQIDFIQWNAKALDTLRQRREESMRGAAEAYRASRMQLKQMQSVLGEVRSSEEFAQERAEQRAADDRYLSRQRWEMRGEQRRQARAGRTAAADVADSFERSE